jgi:hypothetical protein
MSRTIRKGWTAVTGSDSDNRGVKHHATNDWFSKKNDQVHPDLRENHGDGYWGRDKAGVKARAKRSLRRQLNRLENDDG